MADKDHVPSLVDISPASSVDTIEKRTMGKSELQKRKVERREHIESKFTAKTAKRRLETLGISASEDDSERVIGETLFKCEIHDKEKDARDQELYDQLCVLGDPSASAHLLEMFEAMENRLISAKQAIKNAVKCGMCKCEVTGRVFVVVGEADHGHSDIVCHDCAIQEIGLIESNPDKYAICPFCPHKQRLNLVPPYYKTDENITKLVRKMRVEECPYACGTWTKACKMVSHIDRLHYDE
eukprot:jgi/Mesvir1/22/Mv20000-RA.1